MNELTKYLVEQILLEEPTPIKKTIVVYVGRFQPFHKGHNATYEHLVKKFGKDNVYIGTSNKVEKPKSPFNFREKKEIMTTMFGVPSNKIVEVRNPYAPTEVLKKFDEKTTAFITVVGEKDASRLGGKYFEKWNGEATEGYKDKGYVYIAPSQSNAISGTDVRLGLGKGTDKQKQDFFVDKAYTKFNKTIFNLITNKLNESIVVEDAKEDEKYTHVGYGKYKLKGQEKDTQSPSFEKDDSGKYVQIKSDKPTGEPQKPQAGAIQGSNMFKHAPDVKKQLLKKVVKKQSTQNKDWTSGKDGWEILDDDRSKVKNIRDYSDEEYQGETGEYFENDVTKNVAPNAFKDESDMIQKMKEAKPVYLSSEELQNMGNTDVGEILSASEEGGSNAMKARGKELADEYGKDWDRLEKGIEKGNDVPPPIALRDKNGNLHLVAGNTRLMSFTAYGKKLPVKVIDYDGEFNKQAEPADGGADVSKYSVKNLKRKISGWAEKERAFFEEHQDEPKSKERRSWKEALLDKVKGARNAIVHGFKHEYETFKTAGEALVMFSNGLDLTDEQIDAVKSVAKKVAMVAIFGIATGGLGHGIVPFVQHVAMEFVPHIVAETIALGAGKAALFADVNEEERMLVALMHKIADALENDRIPADVMDRAIDSYNKKQNVSEMSKSQLNQIEKYADKQLSPEDIEFTQHFFDRVNDPRNGKQISEPELTGFFKRLARHKKEFKEFLEKYQQIVVKDKRDDINIAFVKQANQIIAKTVMRKSDFKSSNPILSVEGDNIPGGLAKGKTLIDLAKKWDTKGYYDPKQYAKEYIKPKLMKAIKVEMEHTSDVRYATEIAMDHLWEDLNYYEKLSIIEITASGDGTMGGFFNDGNSTTGYAWNADWTDYDDQGYYLDNLEGWSNVHKKPSEFEKKKSTDQTLPIDNHTDGKTSKYNRILKADYKEPAEFLKTANIKEGTNSKNHKPENDSEHNFLHHHKSSMYAPDMGFPAELDTIDFDDKRKKKPGYQTNTKDTEDRGYEPVKEISSSEIIKDLDKVKNDLLKKVDVLVAKKKKLYSNVDIESPMSADEKKLDKEIADLFSQINKLVLQKRSLKTEALKWESDVFDKCLHGEIPLSLNIVKKIVDPIKTTSLHITDIENLPKVVAIEGSKKSISTFNKIDKYGKIAQGKGLWTKGGIIVSISGTILAQSIHDLWSYPDHQGRRWVEPGTLLGNPTRERDLMYNFAPELQKDRKKYQQLYFDKGAITNQEKAEFIKKYFEAAEKYMLSKKKEFQDTYFNSNKLYYDSEWNEVVLTQIKIEKILAIPFVWDGDDVENEKTLKQLKQKYKNVEVAKNESEVQNFIKKNGGTIRESVNEDITLNVKVGDKVLMGKFKNKKVVVKTIGTDEHGMPTINGKKAVTFRYIKENINESKLLVEGGAYGHMNHPFDTDINLTFGQLKNIVNLALEGELELAREKTDGQALAISWVGGRLVAARNKSHLKNKGAGALDIKGVADKFSGRGELEKAYNFAMQDLTSAIKSLSDSQRNKIFKDGSCFMNLEVIYPTSVNVIPYGQPLLVFHGTMEYDMDGNAIGENQQAAKILAGMIKQVNQDVQSNYTIQGPPVLSLPKSQKLSSQKAKYLGKIQSLQKEFGLGDTDGVANYHQAWWENFVTKKSPSMLDNNTKMGLVKRWAFGDKGFRIDNKNITDEKVLQWAQKIDKEDQSKISKDNLMKFEDIFLGVGAEVLQFTSSVLTVNPDTAVREMKKRLDQTVKDVQKSGDPKKIEKLKLELKRLTSIGGPNKIVPIEGIVFVYGGKTFKLTGAFASLNQLLGIFYA